MANTINLFPLDQADIIKSRQAAEALTPGYLIEVDSTDKYAKHSTSQGTSQRIFCLEDLSTAGDVDDDVATDVEARGLYARSGQEVNALVAAGAAAIVQGDEVESAGDGTVAKASDTAASLFIDGAAADGGLTFTAQDAGSDGNQIQIVMEDASTGAVSVDGLTITVTPDTGSNTAGDVVTLVGNSTEAANLVSVSAEGAGTGEPGTDTGSNLAGGADKNPVAKAMEDVDNSGEASEARLKLEVL